jgi:hypothetical protein
VVFSMSDVLIKPWCAVKQPWYKRFLRWLFAPTIPNVGVVYAPSEPVFNEGIELVDA